MHICEMQEKVRKKSFISEIIALQVIALNSACSDGNTCHRLSSVKISDLTKADLAQLILPRIHKKVG